jgi:hypothetical protein
MSGSRDIAHGPKWPRFVNRNGVNIIILTFKRSIRAEVVTYHFDIAIESLHMQQLHGFDELHYDQGIIQNHSAKIDTTASVSVY